MPSPPASAVELYRGLNARSLSNELRRDGADAAIITPHHSPADRPSAMPTPMRGLEVEEEEDHPSPPRDRASPPPAAPRHRHHTTSISHAQLQVPRVESLRHDSRSLTSSTADGDGVPRGSTQLPHRSSSTHTTLCFQSPLVESLPRRRRPSSSSSMAAAVVASTQHQRGGGDDDVGVGVEGSRRRSTSSIPSRSSFSSSALDRRSAGGGSLDAALRGAVMKAGEEEEATVGVVQRVAQLERALHQLERRHAMDTNALAAAQEQLGDFLRQLHPSRATPSSMLAIAPPPPPTCSTTSTQMKSAPVVGIRYNQPRVQLAAALSSPNAPATSSARTSTWMAPSAYAVHHPVVQHERQQRPPLSPEEVLQRLQQQQPAAVVPREMWLPSSSK